MCSRENRTVERSIWVGVVLVAFVLGALLRPNYAVDPLRCPMGAKKSVAVLFCTGSMIELGGSDASTITAFKYRHNDGKWTPEYRQDVTEDGR